MKMGGIRRLLLKYEMQLGEIAEGKNETEDGRAGQAIKMVAQDRQSRSRGTPVPSPFRIPAYDREASGEVSPASSGSDLVRFNALM
jgi:hypothetical protein